MPEIVPILVTDRYEVVELLGQGGMGRVWKARDRMLHRDVAIKEIVPPPNLTDEARQELRVRSLREARAIARLDHVSAVKVFDVLLSADGDPQIVMEYVPSRSLHDVITSEGSIPPLRAAEIGLAVLGALRAAHRAGLVHRDVKPANILIGADGRIVLTDFGLATAVEDSNLTLTGIVLGSPAYVSPERAMKNVVGPAGDLWSLGATLFAAVEGQSPYARPSSMMSLTALVTEPPPRPRSAGPLLPLLEGLLRKDPAERMDADTAEQFLRRVLAEAPQRVALSAKTQLVPRHPGLAPAGPGSPPPAESLGAGPPTAGVPSGPATSPAMASVPASAAATRGLPAPAAESGGASPVVAVVRRRRALLVGALAGVLLLGLGIGIPLAAREAPGDGADVGEMVDAAAPQGTAAADSSASPPAGALAWSVYSDRSGYAVPAPRDWRIVRHGTTVEFHEPDGERMLAVSRTDAPGNDPVAELTEREAGSADGTYRDYRRIEIVAVNYGLRAADWEWVYTAESGTVLHARQRTFATADRQGFRILWSAPEEAWTASASAFRKVTAGFSVGPEKPDGTRPTADVPPDAGAPHSPEPDLSTGTVSPAPPKPGDRIVGVASNRCLDIKDLGAPGSPRLLIRDCLASRDRNQLWTLGSDQSIRLDGRCMDVANASSDDGAVVQLTDCNGTPAQKFRLNEERQLVNVSSGKCLDVVDGRTENGAPVQQWTCDDTTDNQKWLLR
ncbi:serine/threonine protein kinase [Micromonospora musae]|uniref:non-specific serine/threonine protein kinase n=1 Tax=Micromonospora musae TaxID=1894970 RepID=A0ABX9QX79_9ACTN|nr:serine/threonine protein kinase [Micromonospora musae]RKN15002.1 serine/threonine protein kinase [Micromonospora musae]